MQAIATKERMRLQKLLSVNEVTMVVEVHDEFVVVLQSSLVWHRLVNFSVLPSGFHLLLFASGFCMSQPMSSTFLTPCTTGYDSHSV